MLAINRYHILLLSTFLSLRKGSLKLAEFQRVSSFSGAPLKSQSQLALYAQHGIASEDVLPRLRAPVGIDRAGHVVEMAQQVVGGEAQ